MYRGSAKLSKAIARKTEEELWLGRILKECPTAVRSLDASTMEVLYVNPATERIYGRAVGEFYDNAQLWLEAILDYERDRVLQCLSRLSETNTIEIEYSIARPDGEMRYLRDQFWLVRDRDGNPERIDGVVTDISNRLNSPHEEFRNNERRFQKLAANLPGAIYQYILHSDGTEECSYVSPGCREIFELEPEEIQENFALIWGAIHPDDKEAVQESIATTAETLTQWKYEWRIITPSGKSKWISGSSQVEKKSNGDIIWDGVLLDVSDRHIAEAELSATFEQAAVGIAHCNLEGRFTRLNQKFCDIVRYSQEELVQRTYADITHPDDLESDNACARSLLQGDIQTYSLSKRYIRKDNAIIWINLTVSLVREPSGKPKYFISVIEDISSRIALERELAVRQARFDAFFAASPAGFLILDNDLRYVYINEALAEINGVPLAEHFGRTIAEVLPEIYSVMKPVYQRVLQGESFLNVEVSGYTPKQPDSERHWLTSQFPLVGEDGSVVGIGSVVFEISDRKRAEAALAKSEARNRALIEALPDMLFRVTSDGTFVDCKVPREENSAVPASGFLGKRVDEVLPPEIAQQTLHYLALALGTDETQIYEYQLMALNGELRDYEARVALAGEGEVLTIVRDISDRKRAETELKQTQQFLTLVLENMPVAVVTKDAENLQFVLWNRAATDLFGYAQEEILGKTDYDFFPKEQADFFTSKDREALNLLKIVEIAEEPIQVKGGTQRILHTKKTPILNAEGKPVYLLAIVEDITDRKQSEEALWRATRNLQEAQRIAHIGNWEFEVATGNVTWSEELFRIFGLDPARGEPSFEEIQQQVHPDDRELHQNNVARAIAEGEYYEFDYRIFRPDGEMRYINARGEVLKNHRGQVVRLFGTVLDISDRKQIEQTLREQEQFLRTIYEGAEQPIFVVDVLEDGDFRYASWNPAVERGIGVSFDAEYGKSPEDVFGSIVGAGVRARFDNCVKAGTSITFDECYQFTEEESWWALALNPLRNELGKIYRIIGTANNITERKKTEQAIAAQELFLRSIYEGIENFIFVIDVTADGEFRYAGWNPAAEREFGMSSSQISGKTPEEIFGERVGVQLRQRYANCLKAGGAISYEDFYNWENVEVWLLVTLNPLRDSSGNIYRLIGTSHNITERKQAELALQQSEARALAIAQREELLNRLASQIRNSLDLDTILETSVREIRNVLKIDRCNFAWYRLNLESPSWDVIEESKNENLPTQLGVYPATVLGPLNEVLLTGEMLNIDEAATVSETVFREFLVSLGYKSLVVLPIKTRSDEMGVLVMGACFEKHAWSDEELELLSAVALQLAIAINQADLYTSSRESARLATAKSQELEATLRELQKTQSQLIQSEKMSSLGQLVAGVAHEINNPVSFIYGNIQPARDYISDLLKLVELYRRTYPHPIKEIEREIEAMDLDFIAEDLPRLLTSMKVGAERIREIIKSLRTFSRLDEAEMKEVDIRENIDSTLTILQSRFKEKPDRPGIEVIKDYEFLPLIECYAGQLNQVFMNLLSNALDAIDEGYLARSPEEIQANPGRIRISVFRLSTGWVQIRIADNGIGMTKEMHGRIFDPFYTTKPVGKGTGLGLSISYQIVVEKHRGNLHCISERGKGTEFIIEIPQQQLQ